MDVSTDLLSIWVTRCLQPRVERRRFIFNTYKDEIDIVILDMIMPDMGGAETFDKMKAIDSNVKVLLSSGYSIAGQAREILNRGCDGFIQKPFNLAKLSRKISEILHK